MLSQTTHRGVSGAAAQQHSGTGTHHTVLCHKPREGVWPASQPTAPRWPHNAELPPTLNAVWHKTNMACLIPCSCSLCNNPGLTHPQQGCDTGLGTVQADGVRHPQPTLTPANLRTYHNQAAEACFQPTPTQLQPGSQTGTHLQPPGASVCISLCATAHARRQAWIAIKSLPKGSPAAPTKGKTAQSWTGAYTKWKAPWCYTLQMEKRDTIHPPKRDIIQLAGCVVEHAVWQNTIY